MSGDVGVAAAEVGRGDVVTVSDCEGLTLDVGDGVTVWVALGIEEEVTVPGITVGDRLVSGVLVPIVGVTVTVSEGDHVAMGVSVGVIVALGTEEGVTVPGADTDAKMVCVAGADELGVRMGLSERAGVCVAGADGLGVRMGLSEIAGVCVPGADSVRAADSVTTDAVGGAVTEHWAEALLLLAPVDVAYVVGERERVASPVGETEERWERERVASPVEETEERGERDADRVRVGDAVGVGVRLVRGEYD